VYYLEEHCGHELRVWLLCGQELANHFVHDVLRREEVGQEHGQHAADHTRLIRETFADPAGKALCAHHCPHHLITLHHPTPGVQIENLT
jgi:hypothetical protein